MRRQAFFFFAVVVIILLTFGSTTVFAYPDHTFTTNGTIEAGDAYYDVFVDNCTVDMFGGLVDNELSIENDGTVNFYGGVVESKAYVYDSSTLNIRDDTDGGWGVCKAIGYGTSRINMTGGYVVNSIDPKEESIVYVSGGEVGEINAEGISEVYISGASVHWLSAMDLSVINIYGYDFQFIPDGGVFPGEDLLSGFYADGTEFNISIYDRSSWDPTYDHIVTHVVPEPSTLLLLGLGVEMVRRRKQ